MSTIYRKSLEYAIDKAEKPLESAVEIGVFQGGNSLSLVTIESIIELYLVDPYKIYSQYESKTLVYNQEQMNEALVIMRNRMLDYMDRVTVIIQESVRASFIFQENYFDYIYIDGNHSYQDAMDDMRAWYSKVKPGGFLAGHDYATKATAQAVELFAKEKGLKVTTWCRPGEINIADNMKDWIVQKPEEK